MRSGTAHRPFPTIINIQIWGCLMHFETALCCVLLIILCGFCFLLCHTANAGAFEISMDLAAGAFPLVSTGRTHLVLRDEECAGGGCRACTGSYRACAGSSNCRCNVVGAIRSVIFTGRNFANNRRKRLFISRIYPPKRRQGYPRERSGG